MSILIFDSGVGGLSVLNEVKTINPEFDYLYLFDNAGYPYGELSSETLIQRCTFYIQKLLLTLERSASSCDAIIIACNTASTIVLPYLRELFPSIPIIGVVPAIKSAVDQGFKKIGLLATPATVKRPYTAELIHQFAKNCTVSSIGSTELVMMAEGKTAGKTVDLEALRSILLPWLISAPDQHPSEKKEPQETGLCSMEAIVLGCTHFPLLKEELKTVLGNDVALIDSGVAIAMRLRALLQTRSDRKTKHLPAITSSRSDALIPCYCTQAVSTLLNEGLRAFGLDKPNILS